MGGTFTLTQGMSDEEIRQAMKGADEVFVEGDLAFQIRVGGLFGVSNSELPVSSPASAGGADAPVPQPTNLGAGGGRPMINRIRQPHAPPDPPPDSANTDMPEANFGAESLYPPAKPPPSPVAQCEPATPRLVGGPSAYDDVVGSASGDSRSYSGIWSAIALCIAVAGGAVIYVNRGHNAPTQGLPLKLFEAPVPSSAEGTPGHAVGQPSLPPPAPPTSTAPVASPPPAAPPVPPDLQPPTQTVAPAPAAPSNAVELVKALSWPIVFLVVAGIVGFLVWRAMTTGHSVDVRWKVAKIGEGRMVLRKTVTRTPRRAKTA